MPDIAEAMALILTRRPDGPDEPVLQRIELPVGKYWHNIIVRNPGPLQEFLVAPLAAALTPYLQPEPSYPQLSTRPDFLLEVGPTAFGQLRVLKTGSPAGLSQVQFRFAHVSGSPALAFRDETMFLPPRLDHDAIAMSVLHEICVPLLNMTNLLNHGLRPDLSSQQSREAMERLRAKHDELCFFTELLKHRVAMQGVRNGACLAARDQFS